MSSIDDYYLVGEPSHAVTLGVIETSISIEDDAAYSAITPKSVLCWVRAMAANQVAMDAPSWATAFATHAENDEMINHCLLLSLGLWDGVCPCVRSVGCREWHPCGGIR